MWRNKKKYLWLYIHPLIWTYDILQTYEFHMEMTCEGCANAAKRVLGKKGGKPQRHKNILKSEDCMHITKTRLYNFDPLQPHFYTVKLGFTGVHNIFLTFLKNVDCGYSLEPPSWGGSNEYQQSMFWAEIWKISEFLIWKISFFGCKIFDIFE